MFIAAVQPCFKCMQLCMPWAATPSQPPLSADSSWSYRTLQAAAMVCRQQAALSYKRLSAHQVQHQQGLHVHILQHTNLLPVPAVLRRPVLCCAVSSHAVSCCAVVSSTEHMVLLALWAFWCLMLYYSQASISDMKPFDPFEILGVPRDASDREIKKAYRQLSLVYHPDKVRTRRGGVQVLYFSG